MYSVDGSTTSFGLWGGFLNLFDPEIDGKGNFFLLSLLNSSKTKNGSTYNSGFWFLDLDFDFFKLPRLSSFKKIKGALRSYGGLLGFDFQLTKTIFLNNSFILSSFDYLSLETDENSVRNFSFYTCLMASSLYAKENKWTFELTGLIFPYNNSVFAFPYFNIYYSV